MRMERRPYNGIPHVWEAPVQYVLPLYDGWQLIMLEGHERFRNAIGLPPMEYAIKVGDRVRVTGWIWGTTHDFFAWNEARINNGPVIRTPVVYGDSASKNDEHTC